LQIGPAVETRLAQAAQEDASLAGSYARAELTYKLSDALGLEPSVSERLSVAVEYYHLASLFFDDLPCIDDAQYRRNAVCLHQRYDEAIAILLALALINRAYALVWEIATQSSAMTRDLVKTHLAQNLGLEGILNGQALDLAFPSSGRSAAMVACIATGKTESLLKMSLLLPAIVANCSAESLSNLEQLAKCWGIAYQILDDVKDVISDKAYAGKNVQRDTILERPNMAIAIGVDAALDKADALLAIAEEQMTSLAEANRTFTALQSWIPLSTRQYYCMVTAQPAFRQKCANFA